MDLWIRTQDGLSLMKIDNIFLYSGRKGNIATISSGRGILKLAEYKTNERALQVLDEIQGHLEMTDNLKFDNQGMTVGLKRVYNMPKE